MTFDKDFFRRLKLMGTGFGMGVVIVFFILQGKKTRCNWFPNERILNIIRKKHIEYSPQLNELLKNNSIDSTEVNKFLLFGDIDFSKSQVKNKPCRKYWIDGKLKGNKAVLHVKICDSIAILEQLDY